MRQFILCNWDAIIDFMAILAFFAVVVSGAYNLIVNRCKIKIRISRHTENQKGKLMYLSVENLSRLPVCISQVSIEIDDALYECEREPIRVRTIINREAGKEVFREYQKALGMPISIPGLGGVHGFLYFGDYPHNPEIGSKYLNFRVCTNRGRALKMKCEIPDQSLSTPAL